MISIRYVYLFADDTTLFDNGLDKDTLENNLQQALNLLIIWCLENGFVIRQDKTKQTFVKLKLAKQQIYERYLRNNLVDVYDNFDFQLTSYENVVGVHTWTIHPTCLKESLAFALDNTCLRLQHRVLFYNAYIKPHFKYCWHVYFGWTRLILNMYINWKKYRE